MKLLEKECYVIYGPGGSGKSLLLKFLNDIKIPELSYTYTAFHRTKNAIHYLNINTGKKISGLFFPELHYDLYLIDEPENGFEINEFEVLYNDIKHWGKTMVIVTHNLNYVTLFADKILVLRYGECLGEFTKESFFNSNDSTISGFATMGC
ncbi:MAG TPA: ABC transporter ATP-binding protein [Cyclobacteriaceae bacterium]